MDYRTLTAMQRIARFMTRNYQIQVRFSGSTAYTNGKIINLPVLVDAPRELLADIRGYLDHEVAHCKYSDFTVLDKMRNLFHKHFVNAIEDSRIELLLPVEFPGTKFNLHRLNDKLGEKILDNIDTLPWPIRFIIACRAVYDHREPIVDENLALIFEPLKPKILKLRDCKNTEDIVNLTSEIIDDVNRIRKGLSEDAGELTEEELEILQQMGADLPMGLPNEKGSKKKGKPNPMTALDPSAEPNKSKKEKGEGEGEGEGEEQISDNGNEGNSEGACNSGSGNGKDSEQDGNAEDSEDSSSGKSGNADTDGSSEDGDEADSEIGQGGFSRDHSKNSDSLDVKRDGKSTQTWQETEEEASMLGDTDENTKSEWNKNVHSVETMINNDVAEHIKEQRKSEGDFYTRGKLRKTMKVSLPFSRAYDVIKNFDKVGDPTKYAEMKREVMPTINPLKATFSRMLQVEENKRTKFDRERGQINRKSLTTLIVDNQFNRPFKEFTKEITNNVAVSLVIDCSGSMGGSRMELARQTAIALAETLKALDMKFEVVGFSTTRDAKLTAAVSDAQKAGESLSRFNRTDSALELFIFKSFDCDNPVGICNAYASGANGDGESVLWAAERLAERPESRKLMFVLSDGRPAMDCKSQSILEDDLRRVVQRVLPQMNIEPFGIGIETHSVEQFYPDYVVVNNVEDLPRVAMTQLIQMVMRSWKKTR